GSEVELLAIGLQDHISAGYGDLADAAQAKAAPDDDRLGGRPGFGLEEAPRDEGELLRELLDSAQHHGRCLHVVTAKNPIKLLPADLHRGAVAERIIAPLAQGLAPALEHGAEKPPCWRGRRGSRFHPSIRWRRSRYRPMAAVRRHACRCRRLRIG